MHNIHEDSVALMTDYIRHNCTSVGLQQSWCHALCVTCTNMDAYISRPQGTNSVTYKPICLCVSHTIIRPMRLSKTAERISRLVNEYIGHLMISFEPEFETLITHKLSLVHPRAVDNNIYHCATTSGEKSIIEISIDMAIKWDVPVDNSATDVKLTPKMGKSWKYICTKCLFDIISSLLQS